MRPLLILGMITFVGQSFAFESVHEFWETYRSRSCAKSREAAADRVLEQAKKSSDTYDGPIAAFHGKKIVRFIQSETRCEVLWSQTEGRIYDYALRVQVQQ